MPVPAAAGHIGHLKAAALLLSPAQRVHCSNPALCSQPARACLKNFLNLLTRGLQFRDWAD